MTQWTLFSNQLMNFILKVQFILCFSISFNMFVLSTFQTSTFDNTYCFRSWFHWIPVHIDTRRHWFDQCMFHCSDKVVVYIRLYLNKKTNMCLMFLAKDQKYFFLNKVFTVHVLILIHYLRISTINTFFYGQDKTFGYAN